MDIAILVGILGALALVIGAMISAGTVAAFLDWPSALIVIGGTFFVVMSRHSDRKSTRLNSSHSKQSRMPSSA